jgi:hypothetical protein
LRGRVSPWHRSRTTKPQIEIWVCCAKPALAGFILSGREFIPGEPVNSRRCGNNLRTLLTHLLLAAGKKDYSIAPPSTMLRGLRVGGSALLACAQAVVKAPTHSKGAKRSPLSVFLILKVAIRQFLCVFFDMIYGFLRED